MYKPNQYSKVSIFFNNPEYDDGDGDVDDKHKHDHDDPEKNAFLEPNPVNPFNSDSFLLELNKAPGCLTFIINLIRYIRRKK